ncbi:MAG TPA: spore germination protein [Symbiobacteriaceae bacterium]|nr:spore germination protein [Symbiobacteriaceae bacterium]
MTIRSWLRSLILPAGGPAYQGEAAATGPDRAVPPQAAEPALSEYHAALKALSGKSKTDYRAGLLEEAQHALERIRIPAALATSIRILKELFADCNDVIFREILVGGSCPALLLFVDGMVAEDRLELSILGPLTRAVAPASAPLDLGAWLESVAVPSKQAVPIYTIGDAVASALAGDTVLFMEGVDHGVELSTRFWAQRSIEEPVSEANIRGPRDGFIETLRTNTMLVRRRISSPHLKIEHVIVGRRTRTLVDIIYIKGVTNPSLVTEVKRRISGVDIDGLLDSGMLEEFIEDVPPSPFPKLMNTERPDRVAAALLEGQVAVFVDGSPSALLMPVSLWHFMTASEDYYDRYFIGTLVLWLRFLFLLLALLGPSLYVAITSFHQEMIPTNLLLSIAAAREGIPFPVLIEALIMEIFFEALREAGIRLPRQVGQAVSIVGALVIGEAAVRAGLASAPVVIIVAATGIASFTIPQFQMGVTFRLLRFPIMLLAGSLGLFGIMVGLVTILVHLCALRSFGMPYLQPVAPLNIGELKDVLMRVPLWMMGKRPSGMETVNQRRQAPNMKPNPPSGGSS